MDEKHLIGQLKVFSQIKPDKTWEFSVKERLLSQDAAVEAAKPMAWFANIGSFLSNRSGLAVGMATFIGVVLISGSLYFDWFGFSQNPQSQQMVLSLQEMQNKLELVNNSLDDLKNLDNKNQALAMAEVVKSTVKENQKVAQQLQAGKSGLSKQALASLGQFEKESGEVFARTSQVQNEIFEQCFNDLKQRSLSVSDQERLKQAEDFYNQGEVAQAMMILQQIGQ
ncbi:MAG: hypothetical protein PHU56_02435 [Candidatus Pacebacteria bacterium]|nr:hypothetical protein [Candidatus Paceibacterota bacterium]